MNIDFNSPRGKLPLVGNPFCDTQYNTNERRMTVDHNAMDEIYTSSLHIFN
jgi:hypothetical protein